MIMFHSYGKVQTKGEQLFISSVDKQKRYYYISGWKRSSHCEGYFWDLVQLKQRFSRPIEVELRFLYRRPR